MTPTLRMHLLSVIAVCLLMVLAGCDDEPAAPQAPTSQPAPTETTAAEVPVTEAPTTQPAATETPLPYGWHRL